MFEAYLSHLGLPFERNVPVSGQKNVDFRVEGDPPLLCDMKEIRTGLRQHRGMDAFARIRDDLKDLRKKFGRTKPNAPVVLVTVNLSQAPFTGFSIAQAMLGDVGAEFNESGRAEIHHLPRGNASMTPNHNTLITAVFVFDCDLDGDHRIVVNPYAAFPLSEDRFPLVPRVKVSREATEDELAVLSKMMFWPCNESAL